MSDKEHCDDYDEPDDDDEIDDCHCQWCGGPLFDDMEYGTGYHGECEARMWKAIEARDRAMTRKHTKRKMTNHAGKQ